MCICDEHCNYIVLHVTLCIVRLLFYQVCAAPVLCPLFPSKFQIKFYLARSCSRLCSNIRKVQYINSEAISEFKQRAIKLSCRTTYTTGTIPFQYRTHFRQSCRLLNRNDVVKMEMEQRTCIMFLEQNVLKEYVCVSVYLYKGGL